MLVVAREMLDSRIGFLLCRLDVGSSFLQSSVFFDSHLSCFNRRSVELQRAGSGLLDKVITDTRSLKQIPLTEFSSDKDSGKWSFLCQH